MPLTNDAPLRIFTIYSNPADYPGSFVVRALAIVAGGETRLDAEPLAVTKTLDEARAAVPDGLWRFVRSPEDEPQIVESWL